METSIFNQKMKEVVGQSDEAILHKQFEAVATCVMNSDDTSMIPVLMNMCQRIGLDHGINLKQLAEVTLVDKAKEYALNGDRLWNFKTTYSFNLSHPIAVLQGYLLKHLNSCMDMLTGKIDMTPSLVQEKFGDVYNYCILMYALDNDEC